MAHRKSSNTSTKYILEALIPFTEANLKLAFKPNLFFNELERISGRKQRTLKNEFYRLCRSGHVARSDDEVKLTAKGLAELEFYAPKHLGSSAKLMVIFDIPEAQRNKRNNLRTTLRQFRFKQVQQSVWITEYECRKYLAAEIRDNGLEPHIEFYECKQLSF